MRNLIFCHSTDYLNQLYNKINAKNKNYFENSVIFIKSEDDLILLDKKISDNAITIIQETDGFLPKFDNFKLNSRILEEYKEAELSFYSMFDYYEFGTNQIGSKDKRISYYYYLNNLINFVEKYDLKSVFFTHVPHTLIEVLVATFFKKNNLKIILTRGLPIPGLFKFENTIKNIDKSDQDIIEDKDGSEKVINEFIDKYAKKFDIIEDQNNWVNYDLIKLFNLLHKTPRLPYFLFNIFFIIRFFLRLILISVKIVIIWIKDKVYKTFNLSKYVNLRSIFSSKKNYIHHNLLNKFTLEKIFFFGHLAKNKNLLIYKKLTKKIDLKENFFYFPLWFQPSSTTYPFAERYIDYELSLNILSQNLPNNFKIYVKESPDIFNISNHAWFKGNFVRNKKFYDDIAKIPKVSLIDFNNKDYELIDHSKAVVPVSDKYSIISIIRNKPHISFVDTVSSKIKSSFYCDDEIKIQEIINKIINSDIKIENDEKKDFFNWLKNVSFYRSIYGNDDVNKIVYKNNYKKIARCFEKKFDGFKKDNA